MIILFWKTCPQIKSSIAYSFQPACHGISVLISYNIEISNIMNVLVFPASANTQEYQ